MYGCAYGLAIVCLSVVLVTAQRATTQNDINNFARDIFIQVHLMTRHEVGGTYDIIIRFTNRGRQRKILNTRDWEIHFNLKGTGLLTKPSFEENGLRVQPTEGCGYIIQPITTGKNKFKGLTRMTKITITAEGLSLFRYDIYPRFYITAKGKIAKNIQNTDDDEIRFVSLAKANQTDEDMSRVSGLQRSVTQPAVYDVGRVPESLVIPSTRDINKLRGEGYWVDISRSRRWFIYPSASISKEYLELFVDKLSSLPNVTRSMFQEVSSQPNTNLDTIYIQIDPDKKVSKDGYTLAVRPRRQTRRGHIIHISAKTERGLQNALESFLGVTGLFNVVPAMTINDDARFGTRSVLLDVTKNFFPEPVIMKFIRLMKMYKLNNLVLNLADDYGWRLELPARFNLKELWEYSSKRCADKGKCLDPAFGSGADENSSGSGYYSIIQFTNILNYANDMGITITPKFNFLGAIRSAKKALELRYKRLAKKNKREANRLRMNTKYPNIINSQARDHCYKDGLLDPCDPATYRFMGDVISAVGAMYKSTNVPFKEFHAGGDEMTRYHGIFPSCVNQKLSPPNVMRKMLSSLDTEVKKFNAKLRVRQEAVVDPDTKTCLTNTKSYKKQNLIVDFWNIMPGNHDDWGLTAEEMEYINAPVPPPTNDSKPDPMMSFLDKRNSTGPWSKKGIAPWAQAYSCANDGYKVILGPESFLSLDSSYELDVDEIGNRKRERFHIINLHRMMMFEPLNLHTNMDTGNDGFRYLPYRLCHIWECVTLIKKQNIIGLQATIDTDVIRNEDALWESILPGFLLFAEKAWREAPFENLLKAEQPRTLTLLENIDKRAYYLNQEIINFTNTFGYKDSGRLDYNNYTYRVPRPGAHVDFQLPYGIPGPYRVIVKTDFPGADIEFREQHIRNSPWRLLFERDPRSGRISGGYNMSFPTSNQRIQIRIRSTDQKRRSLPISIRGGTRDLWPRDLPVVFRNATCLPIKDAWETELNDVTQPQWERIFYNIEDVARQRYEADETRFQNISALIRDYGRTYGTTMNISLIYNSIQQILMSNTSILSLNATSDVRRAVFFRDQNITRSQSIKLEKQFEDWEREYQKCKKGLVNPLAIFERNRAASRARGGRMQQSPQGFSGGTNQMPGNVQMGGVPGQQQGGAFQTAGNSPFSSGGQRTGSGQGFSGGQNRQMSGNSGGAMSQNADPRGQQGRFNAARRQSAMRNSGRG